MSSNNKEVRSLSSEFQIRAEADRKPIVEGYAVKFDDTTVIGGQFSESVDRSAFNGADMANVVALFNHDWNMPLARTGHGLELEVDDTGVKYRFELGDQSYAKDLAENIRMGNVSTSSFGFTIKQDKWEKRDGMNHRTIMSIEKLYDVSPTTQGAYPTTEVALRSMEEALRSDDAAEKAEELAPLAVTEENVEQQHQAEDVVEEAITEEQPIDESAEGSESAVPGEERVDILIDKSILPHPYAIDEEKRNQTEPEAQTENTMSNSQEKNAPAYIQGLGDSEARAASKFSFGKMIKEAAQGRLTGIEAEMNQEGRSEFSSGKVNVAGGICIPSFIVNRTDAAPMGTATVGSTSAGFGGTIGIDDLGIVEAFAPKDIASQLGVRNLNNLTGDVVFQVQSTKLAAEKPAQGAPLDSANAVFAAVKLAPVRYSAHTRVTDQMLAQSAQDMGAFLAMDIRRAVDAKFNADIVAAISAAADDNAGTPGTLNSYAEATWNPMHLEEKLLAADVDIQGLVTLSSAKAYRVFRELSHDAGSGLLFAQSPLERRNVIGYPTTISSSVTAGEFFMFHRDQMVTGTWGGLNLIIDPYSDADYGVTRIVANVYRDVKTLQAAAFQGMTNVA